jgi:glutamate/tyrosine decarboxylase-like PLP-dependent enzyme
MHGITPFARALDRTLDLASYLAGELQRIPNIEVVQRHEMHLPVVAFRLRSPNGTDPDELQRTFCARICARGRVYVATSELPSIGLVIRACILNHRTDRAAVDNLLAEVRSALTSSGT